ncbi:MAG: hypothetical protein UZ13_01646 [Chloroflexi bacterium OLB13]|nr:MAG: hypothetical protein UZ13_01646 [Chloroflexi bacterium OLB13]
MSLGVEMPAMIAKSTGALSTPDPVPIKLLFTVEEFDGIPATSDNQERLLELIHGKIVEKIPNEEYGETAAWIASVLIHLAYSRKLGRVGVDVNPRPIIEYARAAADFERYPRSAGCPARIRNACHRPIPVCA